MRESVWTRRRPARIPRVALLLLALSLPGSAFASEGHGLGYDVWFMIAGILLAAKLGGELAVRLKQPPVLGELAAGILLGNLGLLGVHAFDHAAEDHTLEFLAEFGVVLLLFEVGLESTLTEMRKVAPQSGLVAILGVVAPMVLGTGASMMLVEDHPMSFHLFVGATLCATSVGITASVLQGLDAMGRVETKVILGAAVIDDVLGLIVLAIVSGLAQSGEIDAGELARISGAAGGFLIGALLLGTYVMPGAFKAASRLRTPGVLAAIAIGLCLLLAGLSVLAGLAAIVGAFAAGLILDEVHVRPFGKAHKHDLTPLVSPIVTFVAPIFFVRTGMLVDLSGVSAEPLILAAALSLVGVVGKVVAGIGVRGQVDKLTVGIGMVPRGEVGLIFAAQGAGIMYQGEPLIGPMSYMAVVLMVMITTIVAPPWLAQRLRAVVAKEKAAGITPPSVDGEPRPDSDDSESKPSEPSDAAGDGQADH